MTTFAINTSIVNTEHGEDPVTLSVSATEGDLMVVLLGERSGTTEADYVCTDPNGTWIKAVGYDNEIGDSGARISMAMFYRLATATDESAFTVTGDNGTTNGKFMSFTSWTPSADYDFTLEETAADGSGTVDWDGTSSGNTPSVSGSDLFEIAVGACRDGGDQPTAGGTNFTAQLDDDTLHLSGGSSNVHFALGIEANGQAGGVKTATINADGSGNEGIVMIAIFSTASAATSFPPWKPHPMQHLFGR